MESEPKISDKRLYGLEKFVADGNDVVDFKLVREIKDLDDKSMSFKPEMCHQIFNEGETVFGFENLKIKIYYTAGSLKPYLGINYSRKVSKEKCDGVEADNILEKLEAVLPPAYLTNLDDFSGLIDKEAKSFRPFGSLLHSFTKVAGRTNVSGNSHINGKEGLAMNCPEKNIFEIYECDTKSSKFSTYLKNMESFIMWFIDAASFVDPDDEKWSFYVLYEKYKTSEGNWCYAFVGYSAVYNFYSYPENIRPRVAQMVILPPFQRQGLAVNLLSAIYTRYRNDPKVKEITVEDPSDDFERLRDYVDARDCLKLSTYAQEFLKDGFSIAMADESKKVLKMTKRQAHRVYEILRLRVTNVNDDKELKDFRLDVKKRLNVPYQKQESDIKRMMRRKFNSVELQQASQLDDASRKTELESNFQLLYAHYQYILDRLEKYASASE